MPLTLLLIGDLHYGRQNPACPLPEDAIGELTAEWLGRALQEAARHATPDAIMLTGDLVNDGNAAEAEQRLGDLAGVFDEADAPVIVCPGNHDPDPETTVAAFGDRFGAHRVGEYILYTFRDVFREDETWIRPAAEIECFLSECAGTPVIALQHGPVYPEIPDATYPYVAANADAILASYDRADVLLSVSGHFHKGREPVKRNATAYMICTAFCRAPFPYYVVTANGSDISVARHELAMPEASRLWDGHTHSHFGYCAQDVHPRLSLERADRLGLAGITCVEHAGQVYLSPDEFWRAEHINRPKVLRRARRKGRDRMEAFRRELTEHRSPRLRIGLEAEIDRDGNLTLLEEDAEGWDVILGAVHWLPSRFPDRTANERERAFLWCVEKMLDHGIHVLAHPFRILSRTERPHPAELYPLVAGMLADAGAAAELNCHANNPNPEFFRACAEAGTRIVLGSDAHSLYEVGDLHPHLRILRSIGLSPDDVGV